MKAARAFLFAHPAKHSLSPAMHNAALNALTVAAQYEARDVAPSDLRAALEDLRTSGAWGANLSIPHKEHALEWLDWVSPEAQLIGAVNTVVVRDAALHGFNTDGLGFTRSLEEAGLRDFAGLEVLILGAGGAARGVAHALKAAGARVAIWNRTLPRAIQLAAELDLEAVNDATLEPRVRAAQLLVNTTAVGLEDAQTSPLPDGWLPAQGWVCDIVYRPLETKLLRDAAQAGLQTIDGLGMLVHQGALAMGMWLEAQGIAGKPDPVVMRAAALERLGQ